MTAVLIKFSSFTVIFVVSSGLESREYGRRDPSRWPCGTPYPLKSALTSPTSGGRSVGIVYSRTQATEFVLFCSKLLFPSARIKWVLSGECNLVCGCRDMGNMEDSFPLTRNKLLCVCDPIMASWTIESKRNTSIDSVQSVVLAQSGMSLFDQCIFQNEKFQNYVARTRLICMRLVARREYFTINFRSSEPEEFVPLKIPFRIHVVSYRENGWKNKKCRCIVLDMRDIDVKWCDWSNSPSSTTYAHTGL
jgi:hypothetical protein